MRAIREALRGGRREWYLLRLANLSTIMREWAALHAVERLAFRGTLLAAAPAQSPAAPTALALPRVRGLGQTLARLSDHRSEPLRMLSAVPMFSVLHTDCPLCETRRHRKCNQEVLRACGLPAMSSVLCGIWQ